MPKEVSAGAVIFRKEKGRIFYLLLNYGSPVYKGRKYWGFAKGHIESGENAIRAARREIREETGLEDIKFLKGFREVEKYFFVRGKEKIFKVVIFFLVRTSTKEIKISPEHIGFKWLLYEEAFNQLTFKNAKGVLAKADSLIIKQDN